MLLGLRTVIHPTADLAASTAWWTRILGQPPSFDEPFYVGFSVGGYELGLDPNAAADAGPVTYWGVVDCEEAYEQLLATGASAREEPRDVGEGIRVASVADPEGHVVGIIENPHFAVPQ